MNFSLLIGIWLGILQLPEAQLPFRFEFRNDDGHPVMIIYNADEKIVCDEISTKGDSLFIRLPLYDSEFRLKMGVGELKGNWINRGRRTPATIAFSATKDITGRFPLSGKGSSAPLAEGRWETWFDAGSPDSSLAIGLFRVKDQVVHGTFLTESGDHRFLEGVIDGDSLKLSVFDGAHAWLYLARVQGESMEGLYYSGNHYKGPFRAKRNDSISLRDPSGITRVEGPFDFRLPDPDSNLVSLTDVEYRNKVRLIQIMGSWCPNCMDETVFLDSVYRLRREEGLEVIGLAFERPENFSLAAENVRRMKKRLQVSYPVLIAGVAKKGEVEKVLPAVQGFFSYPTLMVIDRKGQVVKVHTGFSGPATGEAWVRYQAEFRKMLDRILR
ncbi:MAG: TlpA family protein disulfide reductase [Bacteroidia bacterium]|nr:TlpA family protein disulfide reductase [Bacteroidia bacterium]